MVPAEPVDGAVEDRDHEDVGHHHDEGKQPEGMVDGQVDVVTGAPEAEILLLQKIGEVNQEYLLPANTDGASLLARASLLPKLIGCFVHTCVI